MPKTDKPNILVIWDDDIGSTNQSGYSSDLGGDRTRNIDRPANESDNWKIVFMEQHLPGTLGAGH